MKEYCHPVLVRGRYHVTALTPEEEFDPGEITGYAVLNSSGARLRHELALDDAKAWIEKLAREEDLQRTDPPIRSRPARLRR